MTYLHRARAVARGERQEVVRIAGGSCLCSGVLIDATRLLTASHCTRYGGGWFTVRNSDVPLPRARLLDRHGTLDLALLCLERPVSAPMAILPTPDSIRCGQKLLTIGYGLASSRDSIGSWRARTKRSKVRSVSAAHLVAVADPEVACQGDSGAPAYSEQGDVLLAIVDERERPGGNCGAPMVYTRLDTEEVLDWLLKAGQVAGGGAR